MDRVSIEQHGGRNFIFADLSNMEDEDEIVRHFEQIITLIEQQREPFCTIYDISDSFATPKVTAMAEKISRSNKQNPLARGTSTIGVDSPTKRILARFLRPSMHLARDKADALSHLLDPARWE